MNKVYVVAPLLAVAVFAGYYWQHHRRYTARLVEEQRIEREAREVRQQVEFAAREKAQAEAIAAREQRRQELAVKEAQEAARRQKRTDAEHRRTIAANEERKLRQRVEQLRNEIGSLQTAVTRTVERRRELQAEQAHLVEYVEAAEANRISIRRFLEQLDLNPPPRSSPSAPALAPAHNG
ncbi:MAG: hypothetical protein V4773_09880 [Verrucomicrobiota bacterium]